MVLLLIWECIRCMWVLLGWGLKVILIWEFLLFLCVLLLCMIFVYEKMRCLFCLIFRYVFLKVFVCFFFEFFINCYLLFICKLILVEWRVFGVGLNYFIIWFGLVKVVKIFFGEMLKMFLMIIGLVFILDWRNFICFFLNVEWGF